MRPAAKPEECHGVGVVLRQSSPGGEQRPSAHLEKNKSEHLPILHCAIPAVVRSKGANATF
jgi:hypothetical protein